MTAPARSYLFVPGDRPERFAKARASGADRVVLDLEDAVAPAAKEAARRAVAAWLATAADADLLVRTNAADTPWFAEDLRMLKQHPRVGHLLPKAEPSCVAEVSAALGEVGNTEGPRGSLPAREYVALVESVAGWAGLREMAAVPGLSRIAFGSIDFGVDAGMADGIADAGMTVLRVQIALESRLAGLPPPIDGVTAVLTAEAAGRDAALVKAMGFGAKLCIHPAQVAGVHAALRATERERAWAERVLAAFDGAGGAAVALDGQMIDRPVVERARRALS